jgi:lysophospholipase L1-like esterase
MDHFLRIIVIFNNYKEYAMTKCVAKKPYEADFPLILRTPFLFMMILSLLSVQIQAQTSYKFDFGISTNPPVVGYTKATPANKYTATYANDNVNGTFGFENWDSTAFGAFSRGSSNDNLNRDFVYTKSHSNGFSSFYFSVNVPEGNYTVTFYIGDPGDTATTTIKAEGRRLLLENLHTAKGELVTRTFTVVRREPAIAGTSESVGLDNSYGREYPPTALNWDHKLTFEFCGARPCIGGLDLAKVDSGITLHLCGNSTCVEQEDEPWACWGQFVERFYTSSIIVNNLAKSGLTSSSFLSGRRLKKICSVMKPGDYLFFEFGHNDSKGSVSQSQFQTNMKTYYDSATKHGATMVFVTPTARSGDNDTASSIGSYAQYTRDYAKTLSGAKLVDLNAAVIHMKAALGTSAYGGNTKAIYCYAPASPLWPDQPAPTDDTHFCDFGGYELAKWVSHTGLKAAGIDLQKYLLDTATFNPNKPDLKASWIFPYSLDTTFRHSTHGATVYKDTVGPSSGMRFTASASSAFRSITLRQGSLTIDFSEPATGNAEFDVFSMNGKLIAEKRAAIMNTEGAFTWKELNGLPSGIYFLSMKVDNRAFEKTVFYKY